MRPVERSDGFDIDSTPIWPVDEEDARLEPIFLDGPLWIDFDEADPFEAALETVDGDPLLVGFDEFALSDALPVPEEPEPPARARPPASGLVCSLAGHLLALLVLLGWSTPTGEMHGDIPVQLVIENAPPKEEAPGQEVAQDTEPAPKTEAAATESAPPQPPSAPPAETKVAAASPPPKPVSPPPKPAPPPPRAAVHPAPAPRAAARPTPVPERHPPVPEKPAGAAPAAPPTPTQRSAAAPMPAVAAGPPRAQPVSASVSAAASLAIAPPAAGAGAGRGDYFAQLERLTRPYLYMLSPSFLAGRRGKITLTILVRDDGSVSDISVKRSSGYPDIDQRIEQMIAAVGRFPPLPEALRRPGSDLDFNLVFPEVLQQ